MFELLGMSSNLPSTLNLSISTLASHGAGAASLRDGWGGAYSEGPDVRLIKDPDPASDSDWIRFIGDHSFRSNIVIAHVRTATMGARAYRNTQPFMRELGGRMHCFAHNGWLPHIFEKGGFDSAQFTPIGETDSERAYCGLLERLRRIWRPRQVPALQERLSVVSEFAEELRTLGPANFLYSDGDVLFAHGHRRLQATTTKQYIGTCYIERSIYYYAQSQSNAGRKPAVPKRKSINISGFKHVNPIPNASRIGDILMSGVINGVDPATGKLPAGINDQCANMFTHVRSILAAAGANLEDVIKMTVWLRDPGDRVVLNEEWLKCFPDPGSRPARHALPHTGSGEALILCDVTAVIRS